MSSSMGIPDGQYGQQRRRAKKDNPTLLVDLANWSRPILASEWWSAVGLSPDHESPSMPFWS